jgi:hypothetical protein
MKTSILLLTTFLLGISIAAQPSAPSVGRYQLVSGAYNAYSPGASRAVPMSGLFRMDTATGEIEEIIAFEENGRLKKETKPFLPPRP